MHGKRRVPFPSSKSNRQNATSDNGFKRRLPSDDQLADSLRFVGRSIQSLHELITFWITSLTRPTCLSFSSLTCVKVKELQHTRS
jgi:hypothetical protein